MRDLSEQPDSGDARFGSSLVSLEDLAAHDWVNRYDMTPAPSSSSTDINDSSESGTDTTSCASDKIIPDGPPVLSKQDGYIIETWSHPITGKPEVVRKTIDHKPANPFEPIKSVELYDRNGNLEKVFELLPRGRATEFFVKNGMRSGWMFDELGGINYWNDSKGEHKYGHDKEQAKRSYDAIKRKIEAQW